MEQNTDRMGFALIALSVVAVVLLIMNTFFGPTVKGYFSGFKSWQESTFSQINTSPSNKINPNDAKWITKGDWGSNGKFVVDKDGNAVIYAMEASKPIIFHDMSAENDKLPYTVTTLTFQDKVQGDTNSSMTWAFGTTLPNLKTINNLDTNVDTSNVTNMSSMFSYSKLTSVGDLGQWNTSNVTDMSGMFSSSRLTSVGDLGQWDTSNVTNIGYMFRGSQLTSVGDLGQWNTSNVTDMSAMFQSSRLTSVGDLGQWNTSNVKDMGWMFGDSQLTSVGDLSQWNTSNVTYMSYMFAYSKLTTVGDLSQWDTSNVNWMSSMFEGSKLTPPSWYRWDAEPEPM